VNLFYHGTIQMYSYTYIIAAILHLPVRLIVLDYKADKFFPCLEQEPAEYEP